MDRTLPVVNKLPFNENAFEDAFRKNDPQYLIDYMKKLIRALMTQYERTSNTVNILAADALFGASADRPTASANYRGIIYITESGTGVADTAEICLKSTADTYSWKNLATG